MVRLILGVGQTAYKIKAANKMYEKIKYNKLNSKQQEVYNFQRLAGLMAEYGFNCIKLSDDWNGADFLAYHFDGESTLKVQLKGRLTIDKRYKNEIYMAFPINDDWYLIKHGDLKEIIGTKTKFLLSDSWINGGGYSTGKPSKIIIDSLTNYKLT